MKPESARTNAQWIFAVVLLVVVTLALSSTAAAEERAGPLEWLDRMSNAVATLEYEGTVIRRQRGESQALKVVHMLVDGVVNEKLVTQEGNGLEIVRVGNEVHCILPDRKAVLIETWQDQSTLFSTLPDVNTGFGSVYDMSVVREERVAGRPTVLLAIRPHDLYRFGHRLWLDRKTGFPLRTELVGTDGELIEQLKFADIDFSSKDSERELQASMNLDNFTWYTQPQRYEAANIETDWVCAGLPIGFKVVSTRHEEIPGAEGPVTHIVYGDGLATVSVFIAEDRGQDIARRSNVGASHSFSTVIDKHQVTAVGEVPSRTVERIATSMRR